MFRYCYFCSFVGVFSFFRVNDNDHLYYLGCLSSNLFHRRQHGVLYQPHQNLQHQSLSDVVTSRLSLISIERFAIEYCCMIHMFAAVYSFLRNINTNIYKKNKQAEWCEFVVVVSMKMKRWPFLSNNKNNNIYFNSFI